MESRASSGDERREKRCAGRNAVRCIAVVRNNTEQRRTSGECAYDVRPISIVRRRPAFDEHDAPHRDVACREVIEREDGVIDAAEPQTYRDKRTAARVRGYISERLAGIQRHRRAAGPFCYKRFRERVESAGEHHGVKRCRSCGERRGPGVRRTREPGEFGERAAGERRGFRRIARRAIRQAGLNQFHDRWQPAAPHEAARDRGRNPGFTDIGVGARDKETQRRSAAR